MKRRAYLLFAFVLVLGSAFAANQMPKRITGIYSSLTQSQNSGDLDGMEMLIIPGNESSNSLYIAFVQVAEGGAPYTATVQINLTANRIEFSLPPRGTTHKDHFIGTFKGSELVIRRDDGNEMHLKRGNSFWQ